MKYSFFEATYQGARKNNQDYFSHQLTESWSLFIVTDGLGGHEKGEVAAKEFCEACKSLAAKYSDQMQKNPHETMSAFIKNAAKLMCDNICKKYGLINTQTVFALVWLTEKNVITAHIGDARVYRLSANHSWRTSDHTFVQQLFEQHQINEEDFGTHPLQNRLLNALNTFEEPIPEIHVQNVLRPDETLLLCSDGFWGRLKQNDLQIFATSTQLEQDLQNKIAQILSQFAKISDNITVQSVRVS